MTEPICTCPTDLAALLRAHIENALTCPAHRPQSDARAEPPALNSDALTQSLAAALGGSTTPL